MRKTAQVATALIGIAMPFQQQARAAETPCPSVALQAAKNGKGKDLSPTVTLTMLKMLDECIGDERGQTAYRELFKNYELEASFSQQDTPGR